MMGRLIALCFLVAVGCVVMALALPQAAIIWFMFAGYAAAAGVVIAAVRWVFAGWA